MESKLCVTPFLHVCSALTSVTACSKALKVVELKDILSKAHVAVPSKANKAELVAKLLASPDAISIVEGTFGQSAPAKFFDPETPNTAVSIVL